jgi:hypothetical protein
LLHFSLSSDACPQIVPTGLHTLLLASSGLSVSFTSVFAAGFLYTAVAYVGAQGICNATLVSDDFASVLEPSSSVCE